MNNNTKILRILKKNKYGLNISEIERQTKLSRSLIRTTLSKLEGERKVSFYKAGMSKVYCLVSDF